jgi:hypothetical protein
MTSATLIRSVVGASSALAMTMCHAAPELDGLVEHGAADSPASAIDTFVSASWNANVEPSHAACIRVLIQPRLACYNPAGAPTAPGLQFVLRQALRGGIASRTYILHSSIDLLSIYNVASYADVELQLQFPNGAAAHGCATGLALSTIPAGIAEQATSKITFDPGAVWGDLVRHDVSRRSHRRVPRWRGWVPAQRSLTAEDSLIF